MKQRISQLILITFLILFATLAFGQVRIGVSGGVNFTNGKFAQSSSNRIALGFHAGILSDITLHKKIYLQPLLQYSLQGWSLNHPARGSRIRLHYLNLPLLVGYKPLSKLSLLAGPQVGMLIKADMISEEVDIGINLGTKYHLTSKLGLEVRYIHGLTHLTEVIFRDTNGDPTATFTDGYNRTLQVSMSYLFGNKHPRD